MEELLMYYRKICSSYKEIEYNFDEKSIHDKRVFLRRIFSLLNACGQPINLKFKTTFKFFGKLRNIQIQIIIAEGNGTILEEYLKYLKEKEAIVIKKLEDYVIKNPMEFEEFLINSKMIKKISKDLKKKSKKLKKLVKKINSPKEFHNFRIVFKKFRYDLELFYISTNSDLEGLKDLKYYQDVLGEIQDLEVFIKSYKKFYSKKISNFVGKKTEKIENLKQEKMKFLNKCIMLFKEAEKNKKNY